MIGISINERDAVFCHYKEKLIFFKLRKILVSDFACSQGVRQTGVKNSILISNYSRSLWIKTFTARKTKDWADAIEKVVTGSPGQLTEHAVITHKIRGGQCLWSAGR